jgi:class 3 adenylate cyclase
LQKDQADSNETVKIENAIIKIGTLLALGFGDAGSEIIGSNMAKTGDVDPMLPGKKKCAIYGFCDIRNFTDATEVLQEDVMVFVNNIGHVVHTIVDRFAGAANKNIGDAFLLVWKIREGAYEFEADGTVVWKDQKLLTMVSECALISFMKIQAKLSREPKILAYRKDKRLLERMAGYKVKMGFGLHMGWGIEGAIGSEFKIDASYLSPNVNMASRLEAATKQFGVPLLISEALHEHFR